MAIGIARTRDAPRPPRPLVGHRSSISTANLAQRRACRVGPTCSITRTMVLITRTRVCSARGSWCHRIPICCAQQPLSAGDITTLARGLRLWARARSRVRERAPRSRLARGSLALALVAFNLGVEAANSRSSRRSSRWPMARAIRCYTRSWCFKGARSRSCCSRRYGSWNEV